MRTDHFSENRCIECQLKNKRNYWDIVGRGNKVERSKINRKREMHGSRKTRHKRNRSCSATENEPHIIWRAAPLWQLIFRNFGNVCNRSVRHKKNMKAVFFFSQSCRGSTTTVVKAWSQFLTSTTKDHKYVVTDMMVSTWWSERYAISKRQAGARLFMHCLHV